MSEQEEFFSQKHKLLLSVATWAKYLAWPVLVVFTLYGIGLYFQEQARYSFFNDQLRINSLAGLSLLVQIIGTFLKGVIYHLLLRGIALGLTMIVETNINYGEISNQGDAL